MTSGSKEENTPLMKKYVLIIKGGSLCKVHRLFLFGDGDRYG